MSLPACPVCGAKDSSEVANGYASEVALCRACAFYCSPEIWRALADKAAKAAVLDTLTAKLDALHAADGGRSLEPYTAHHLSTIIAERLAVERAKRGIAKETPST